MAFPNNPELQQYIERLKHYVDGLGKNDGQDEMASESGYYDSEATVDEHVGRWLEDQYRIAEENRAENSAVDEEGVHGEGGIHEKDKDGAHEEETVDREESVDEEGSVYDLEEETDDDIPRKKRKIDTSTPIQLVIRPAVTESFMQLPGGGSINELSDFYERECEKRGQRTLVVRFKGVPLSFVA